jgi:general secretion pathway protein D
MTNDERRRGPRPLLTIWTLSLAVWILAACAGAEEYRDGKDRLARGESVAGLQKIRAAMDKAPENLDYRHDYFVGRERALNAALRSAEDALANGDFDAARRAFTSAAAMDPQDPRVQVGTERVDRLERDARALDAAIKLAEGGDLDAAVARTREVVSMNGTDKRAAEQLRKLLRQQEEASGKEAGLYPRLKAAYRVPVSLSLNNATVSQVFESLHLASGLNYVLERDVKLDQRVTLSVSKKPVEDVLRLILATNQLLSRVLDEDTILIYPNTPAKAQEYREMVVRTFYLHNSDAARMADTLKTIVKARDVVVDARLNALIVRDTQEVIRLAERLVAAQDLAEPEVVLDLEVLELGVSDLIDMGIRWPDMVSAGVVGSAGTLGQLTLDELKHRTASMVNLTTNDPLISAQLKSIASASNLLANPRVRVRSKEAAKVMIGERVPVITTNATANVGTSQSVSYLDVGLKLEVEPTVSLDEDVAMKVGLEVSSITQTITLEGGAQAYRLGTRNTSTTLRVHDGETNVLAGLIQRDERHSNSGIPGMNQIPVLGRLFGAAEDNTVRTEIVLLITPHIVRALRVPGVGQQEFLSGTDGAIGAPPLQLGTSVTAGRAGGEVLRRAPPARLSNNGASAGEMPAPGVATPQPQAPPLFYPNPASPPPTPTVAPQQVPVAPGVLPVRAPTPAASTPQGM